MSTEQVTKTTFEICSTISRTRNSCAGFLNDQRKQMAIACTPSASRLRIAASASVSFSETTISPKQSTRSETPRIRRSEEHTSELQSRLHLVCRLLLEKKKKTTQKKLTYTYTT